MFSWMQANDTFLGVILALLMLVVSEAWSRTYFPGEVQRDEKGNEKRDEFTGEPVPFPQGAALFYHLCATTVNAVGLALGILAIFGLHLPYTGVCLVFASVIGYVYFEWKARKYDDRSAVRGSRRGEGGTGTGLTPEDVKELVTALHNIGVEGYELDGKLRPVRRSSGSRAPKRDLVEVE